MTVLLARNRQPPPTVAAGVPHAELAAELISLPSGLLAMVCEAIVKLKVRLAGLLVQACVRLGSVGNGRGADEVPARAKRLQEAWAVLSSRVGPADGVRSAGSTTCSTGLVLSRFPMLPEPAGTPSARALCAVVRD